MRKQNQILKRLCSMCAFRHTVRLMEVKENRFKISFPSCSYIHSIRSGLRIISAVASGCTYKGYAVQTNPFNIFLVVCCFLTRVDLQLQISSKLDKLGSSLLGIDSYKSATDPESHKDKKTLRRVAEETKQYLCAFAVKVVKK